MKNKFSSLVVANAAALIAILWYLFCWIFYIISPSITEMVFQSWLHAFNLSGLWSMTFQGNFFLGLISWAVSVWGTVYLFSVIYKGMSKKN